MIKNAVLLSHSSVIKNTKKSVLGVRTLSQSTFFVSTSNLRGSHLKWPPCIPNFNVIFLVLWGKLL